MRACMMLAACAGVLLLSGVSFVPAAADEKKDPGKGEGMFTEQVTFRRFKDGKETEKKAGVDAYRRDVKGQTVYFLRVRHVGDPPARGDHVVDKDGKVWVVEKADKAGGNFPRYVCYTKPQ